MKMVNTDEFYGPNLPQEIKCIKMTKVDFFCLI